MSFSVSGHAVDDEANEVVVAKLRELADELGPRLSSFSGSFPGVGFVDFLAAPEPEVEAAPESPAPAEGDEPAIEGQDFSPGG